MRCRQVISLKAEQDRLLVLTYPSTWPSKLAPAVGSEDEAAYATDAKLMASDGVKGAAELCTAAWAYDHRGDMIKLRISAPLVRQEELSLTCATALTELCTVEGATLTDALCVRLLKAPRESIASATTVKLELAGR